MSNYDDESRSEYSQTMTEWGFDDIDHEDGLDDALEEFADDLDKAPERVGQVVDYMSQGYDLADAAYYAGYGNGTEGLHKVLKKDTGQGVKDKIKVMKDAHKAGKESADRKLAEKAEA